MTHDDQTNALKVADIFGFIEQPLTAAQKRSLPHVLTLALGPDREQAAKDSDGTGDAYWPDFEDPLALVHGKVKQERLQKRCNALAYLVVHGRGQISRVSHDQAEAFLVRIPAQELSEWNDALADAGVFISRLMHSQGTIRP